jgi:hypothetical protein
VAGHGQRAATLPRVIGDAVLQGDANPGAMIFDSARVPIVQRPRTRPFQGRDPGSNPGGDESQLRTIW